jgi:hypothetical protein
MLLLRAPHDAEKAQELDECLVQCGMPGKVKEITQSCSAVRKCIAVSSELAWQEMEIKLRPTALRSGFYSAELDRDLLLTRFGENGGQTTNVH